MLTAVEFYHTPFVPGVRHGHYYGPVSARVFVPRPSEEEIVAAEDRMLDLLAKAAVALGANTVIGLDVTMDPFAEDEGNHGLAVHGVGTAAKLELWYDSTLRP